jgi:membrane protease YdiL (CAAX protease family)
LIIDSSSITLSPLMTIISFLISVIFIYTTLKGFLRNKRIYGNKGVFFLIISSMLLSVFLLSSYFYFIPEDYFSFRSQFRDLFFLYDYLLGIFMLLPFISFILISKGDK